MQFTNPTPSVLWHFYRELLRLAAQPFRLVPADRRCDVEAFVSLHIAGGLVLMFLGYILSR